MVLLVPVGLVTAPTLGLEDPELVLHDMVISYEVLLGFEAKGNHEDRESRSYREGPRRYSFKDA